MAPSITITLGATLATEDEPARTYTVRVLPRGANAAWRQDVLSHLSYLSGIVRNSGLGALLQQAGAGSAVDDLRRGQVSLTTIQSLLGAAESIVREIALSPDWCYHQVLAYAPEIAADCEWVDAHATDAELIEAFVAIIRGLVIPLDPLMKLAGLGRGLTVMNSPSPNGTSLTQAAARKER